MLMFRVCVRAPAGMSMETVELRTLNDAPAVETTAPSLTFTSADALWPSTVAVIVAVPSATPVITPAATVAIEGSELDHSEIRLLRVFPAASLGTACAISVPPGTIFTGEGRMLTLATG
jgi:hypothetical protein